MNPTVNDNDNADTENFYATLYDYYVTELTRLDAARFWEVLPSPCRYVSRDVCELTIQGTREHWALHVTRTDSHEEFDLSPAVAHWLAWTHGGLDTAESNRPCHSACL
jgi:hypothetical protein